MNIKNFISEYEDMTVTVSPGVSYSLRNVIDENYRLFNAKFEKPKDSSGLEKVFYRMIWVIWRTIIMSSDIDLKDMNIKSLNGKGIRTLALFKLAIRSHLMRTFFGNFIDEVMGGMVWFGSDLTKRFDGKLARVDLRNYVTEPTIKDPQKRSHVEFCYYTYEEMLSYKKKWSREWKDVEALWEKMQKQGESLFTVAEYWTWFKDGGEIHKGCLKYLDKSLLKPTNSKMASNFDPYLELDRFVTPYKKELSSKRMAEGLDSEYEELFPYEQANFFHAPGRWLDFGCGELLAGIQEHYNETTNLKRKKDLLDLRGIFIHKYTNTSNSLTQEFLDNLETGSVLSMDVNEDLQRVIIDTKTGEYINSVDKMYEVMRLILGVTAQGTGEELPGSTSASGVKANFAAQQTTYDFVRERMHHYLTRLFMNGYFGDVVKEITKEDIIAIIGSPKELAEFDKPLVKNLMSQRTEERYNYIEKTKGDVSAEDLKVIQDLEDAESGMLLQDLSKMGDTRWAKLEETLLDSLEHQVEFSVTNETFEKSVKLETLGQMRADPNFTGSRKAVEDAIFDLMNENPRQFDKTAEEIQQEIQIEKAKMTPDASTATATPATNSPATVPAMMGA